MQDIFTPPQTLSGDTDEKLVQIRSYLFQLAEKLNRSVKEIDDSIVVTSTEVAKSVSKEQQTSMSQAAANLKQLIIQNAQIIEQEIETLDASLNERYVAISEFGEYQQTVEAQFQATPEYVKQEINFDATVSSINDALATLTQYQSEMSGYIKSGIVDWDGVNPVIGIAIGQDLLFTETQVTVDGTVYTEIDKRQFSSVFTATQLAFYQGDQKVAYLANDRLYITDAIFTGTVHHGSNWEISHTNGYTIKWIGA